MTVHWILFGSTRTGSSRIHGHRIHEELTRQGFDSRLLVAPPPDVQMYDLPWANPEPLTDSGVLAAGDTVIFETVRGERARRLADHLLRQGVQVCFLECDLYPESKLADSATIIVCTSRFLAEEMQRRHPQAKIIPIPDPFEDHLHPEDLPLRVRQETTRLRLVWVGQGAHWETLAPLREILKEFEFQDLKLTTVSNHPAADLMWSPATANTLLRSSDLLVVPAAKTPQAQSKSGNRVVQGMALGCAVLAGDLPAYREVIESGINGFICSTPEEWKSALRSLRDISLRRSIVYNAFQSVIEEYSLPRITSRYVEVLGLSPNEKRIHAPLPAGFQAEQSAEYACWYLAQHRLSEGVRWMTAACTQERSGTGCRVAWKVFSTRCRRKLRPLLPS